MSESISNLLMVHSIYAKISYTFHKLSNDVTQRWLKQKYFRIIVEKWCRPTDTCWKKWWAAVGRLLHGSGWHGGSRAAGPDLKTIFFMVTELSVFFVWDTLATHLVTERGSLFWRTPGRRRIPFETFENGFLGLVEDRTNSQMAGHQIRIHLKLFMKAGLTYLELISTCF